MVYPRNYSNNNVWYYIYLRASKRNAWNTRVERFCVCIKCSYTCILYENLQMIWLSGETWRRFKNIRSNPHGFVHFYAFFSSLFLLKNNTQAHRHRHTFNSYPSHLLCAEAVTWLRYITCMRVCVWALALVSIHVYTKFKILWCFSLEIIIINASIVMNNFLWIKKKSQFSSSLSGRWKRCRFTCVSHCTCALSASLALSL